MSSSNFEEDSGARGVAGWIQDNLAGTCLAEEMPLIPARFLVALLAVCGVLVALLLRREQLVIDPLSGGLWGIVAALLGLFTVRHVVRDQASYARSCVKDFCENALMFAAIVLLGVIASYPTASGSSGFVDEHLARIDALLRFNWVGWYEVVAAHPILQKLGTFAYQMIFVSPGVLLAYFAITGRRAEARRFLFTFWLAALLTLMVFPLIPARGPLAFLWHGQIPYMPVSGLYQDQLIPELRRHAMHDIDLGALRGLVCVPSFHTVSGVLYIAAAWPIARLRWPILWVNLAMLLATPVEGNHYLTDMIAGLAIAVIAIVLVRAVLGQMARPAFGGTALAGLT